MGDSKPILSEEVKALAEQCNEKHVRVVQAILSGDFDSNTAAYESIYPESSYDSARDSVCKLLAIPCNKALHSALREERLLEGVMSRSEAMKILSDMASTSLSELVTFSTVDTGAVDEKTGEKVVQAVWSFKDSALNSEKAMRSISELNASRDGLKIKQHDQKAAIKQLADMAGWNEAQEIKVTGLEVAGDLLYRKDDG